MVPDPNHQQFMFGNSLNHLGVEKICLGYAPRVCWDLLGSNFQTSPKRCVFFHGHLPYLVETEKNQKHKKKTSGYKPTFTNVSPNKMRLQKKTKQTYTKKNFPPSPVVSGTPQRTHLHQGEQVGLCHQSIWMIFTQDLSKTFTQGRAGRGVKKPGFWVEGFLRGPKKKPGVLGGLAESNLSKSQKIKLSC